MLDIVTLGLKSSVEMILETHYCSDHFIGVTGAVLIKLQHSFFEGISRR